MATLQATPAFTYENFYDSQLTSDITASATDIFLDTVPAGDEGTLIIEPDSASNREIIYYNSKTATKVTCPSAALGRGYDNTTATTHSAGARVIIAPIADWFNSLREAIARNGWMKGSGTWTYGSATTMTVPAADAALISVGTKIWLTQTTSKYFYVTGKSGTTITLNGGTDYTLANAAITAPYYSNDQTPLGFPHWFNYTPTWSKVSGTAPVLGNGELSGRFSMNGKTVIGRFKFAIGSTSNINGAGTWTFTLPVTADITNTGATFFFGAAYVEDAGIAGYSGWLRLHTASVYTTHAPQSSGMTVGDINSTVPHGWASSDYMKGTYSYEAAS